jgi:hypothetical protein
MNDKILNLTQHEPTPEQVEAGVVMLDEEFHESVRKLLTVDEVLPPWEIGSRIFDVILLIKRRYELMKDEDRPRKALIGGAPFLMSRLEFGLLRFGLMPVYAFSKRESVEEQMPDGSVVKKNVFKHRGFIQPWECEEDALFERLGAKCMMKKRGRILDLS